MQIERTKNATRNVAFGLILKIYQIIIPFILRTAMIYHMGVQYLGLDSLFVSILRVLNLAELGVGSAMVYSMYKPIVDDDTRTICALMKLYRLYYRIIGVVIGVIGLLLTPFVPRLINGTIPSELNVYILYLLNLAATVLSYWLFAYKSSLFQAHQRVDIISKVTLITKTIQYATQIIVIIFIKDYYLYVVILLLTQILNNILTALLADRMYPAYEVKGNLEKYKIEEINQRIRDLFTSKVGVVIVNSVDTVVISAFLGLTALAIYQNYYYILTSVIAIVSVIFHACTAGIGNSIIVETKEKNVNDLRKFTFLICWIAGVCTNCLLCLYQPFMEIWVGEELMLDFSAVICFCVYYFVHEINQLLNTYKDASGIWHEDRFRPLITALSNLAMNLIMVQFWGIYGVLLSTVMSTLFIGMPWLLRNLFTILFDVKYLKGYLFYLLKFVAIIFGSCMICYWLCQLVELSKWGTLIARGVICSLLPNIIYFAIYRNTDDFAQCVRLVKRMIKGKILKEERI